MDALRCISFFLTFPLNSIAACLGLTSVAFAQGGVRLRSAILAYVVWTFIDRAPTRGGYKLFWQLGITQRLRKAFFWRWSSQYFPVSLKATAPLASQDGPYVFVCHPHGIIGISPMTSFGTDATGFSDAFPGVQVHLLGHNAIFRIPLFREWCLMHGHSTVDKSACLHLLRNGRSIALAPGGAKESLECVPGTMRLYLQQRKGFAKIALRTGASLVPVLGFGENDAYTTVQFAKSSWSRTIQDRLQAIMGIAIPLFCGLAWMPLMPRRVAVTTVVGAALKPALTAEEPTEEMVTQFHAEYCSALRKLFEEHKSTHGMADVKLEII